MNMKDDLMALKQSLDIAEGAQHTQELDDFHALAWRLLWRHRKVLKLSSADLLEIGNGGTVHTMGGGTNKTPPPPEG